MDLPDLGNFGVFHVQIGIDHAENPMQVQADVSIFDAMLKNLEAKRQLGDK